MPLSFCKRHLTDTQQGKRLRLSIPSVFGTITNCPINATVNCVLLINPFLKNGVVSPGYNVMQWHCDVAADLLFLLLSPKLVSHSLCQCAAEHDRCGC